MKKTKTVKKTKVQKVDVHSHGCSNFLWSWAIYVYWFIILFFIAATFYIIGRGHEFLKPTSRNVVVSEEALMHPQDYVDAAKEKIIAGDIEAAIVDLDAAVGSNANASVYTLRGEAYMQMGDYQKALSEVNKLKDKDKKYALDNGIDKIIEHAYDIINKRLAPELILNDGKQTPMRGHPTFVAQHATGTCCRGCLYKWHHIPKNVELTNSQQEYIVDVIMKWIEINIKK